VGPGSYTTREIHAPDMKVVTAVLGGPVRGSTDITFGFRNGTNESDQTLYRTSSGNSLFAKKECVTTDNTD
jgi:hypothetical protein